MCYVISRFALIQGGIGLNLGAKIAVIDYTTGAISQTVSAL